LLKEKLKAMDEEMLAGFASPVPTKGFNGPAFAILVFGMGRGPAWRKFTEDIISRLGASEPQALELYSKLLALEEGDKRLAINLDDMRGPPRRMFVKTRQARV
jgi:hypothetical protein